MGTRLVSRIIGEIIRLRWLRASKLVAKKSDGVVIRGIEVKRKKMIPISRSYAKVRTALIKKERESQK